MSLDPMSKAGIRLQRARAEVARAMEEAERVGRAELAAGRPEAMVARELGVDRMTVRKWAGKR